VFGEFLRGAEPLGVLDDHWIATFDEAENLLSCSGQTRGVVGAKWKTNHDTPPFFAGW
jgi:hypothetical protein